MITNTFLAEYGGSTKQNKNKTKKQTKKKKKKLIKKKQNLFWIKN